MKKFSLTHKLLAVALAFVLVAVSLPTTSALHSSRHRSSRRRMSLKTVRPTAIRLMTICLVTIRLTPGNRKWNSRSSCICRRLRLSRWGRREVLGFQPKIQQQPLLLSLSS